MPDLWRSHHIPDAVFPSDNDLDIPLLRPDLQPIGLDLPLVIWGSTGRKAAMHGTWGFYTDDYRFSGLWTAPQRMLNTGPAAVIEPNFSVHDNLPRPLAIYATYRKRWLARLWQEMAGIKVWVDLNVGTKYADINLYGVPQGWRAFATRGASSNLESLEFEYAIAARWAAPAPPLFLVYGGGKRVKDLCRERGWLFAVEQQDAAQHRPLAVEPYLNLTPQLAAHSVALLQAGPPVEDGR